ncbi:hypothetical protein BU17DRAFT_95084 [Hysterangium stoloniferum]|nr:hypothetical protein BU17DRAFT_95084 [Hysterangium stoloniferum]
MANLDRNALWSAGHDESVEVNQRALIDKVLARYSGEFTVFRELLQNSDDAASKAVEIRFETKEYLNGTKTDTPATVIKQIDLKQPVHQWTFRNNGIVFREEDWSRLKKIAEGNPDEEKIGAFGVGFYSLFSVTEEPFVKSGDKWMGFYWKDKKDQLFARRGDLPDDIEDTYRQWTTFEMELREAVPMPTAFDFVRFLTSSITFMAHIENVTVWFDGHRLANVTKDKGVSKQMPVPSSLRSKSDAGMMTMKTVKTTSLNISVEVMRLVYTGGSEKRPPPRAAHAPPESIKPANTGFFSSLFSSLGGSSGASPTPPSMAVPLSEPVVEVDQTTPISSHVVLSVFSGEVDVTLPQKMVAELHRSTKKNPPSKLRLEIIYTGKDEYDASKKDEEGMFEKTGSLFQGLRADLDGTGSARGHATAQTTGIGGHMSARFIPTVERESIDLVDRNVAVWNKELLYIGGLLSRVAYEMELSNVRNLWAGASVGKDALEQELREWLQKRCLHALRFFSFQASTPSPIVSNLVEAAFFSSSLDGSFPIISTVGVLDARDVRIFDPTYAGFIKSLPVIPQVVALSAQSMVDTLRGRGMLKEIAFTDVLTELRSRPLTEAEMIECLKWRVNLNTEGIRPTHLAELRREFLDAAVFSTTDGVKSEERLILLSSIKTVHIPRNATTAIPTDGPFPEHTLPYSISRQLKVETLSSLFGWTDLTIPMWLQHLLSLPIQNGDSKTDLTKDAIWAEKVLGVLARVWPSLSKEDQVDIVGLLRSTTCIPTKFGMKEPSQSYFLNANVFPDLPIVSMPKGTVVKGPMEKLLLALGVQQHVDLQLVFKRMMQTGDWGIQDLIHYLVAVESSLTALEMDRLRETVAFSKEGVENPTAEGTPATTQEAPRKIKHRARELYEPSPVLRELGLPILAWGTTPKWRSSSDEAKFLYKLGLKRHPPLKDLLSLAANDNAEIWRVALNYFILNASTKYPEYNPETFASLSYVPAHKPDGTSFMGKPNEVFMDSEYSIMGFSAVHTSLPAYWATTLKLPKTPPVNMILPILKDKMPRDLLLARKWFELLSGRLSDFSTRDLQYLSNLDFIPTTSRASHNKEKERREQVPPITMLAPNKCYLSKESSTGFHSQLFTFVDFGSRANSFLMACGVRTEPTVDELAQILVADPRKFYDLSGGYDRFLIELRNIAVNFRGVSASTRNRMKRTACLVASRRVARTLPEKRLSRKAGDDSDDEDEKKMEHDLLIPDQIAIVDDMAAHIMFDTIYTAPQEDYIEQLYTMLGSPLLSSVVHEEYKPSTEIKDSSRALEMRRLVLERLPLFLHERTHGKTTMTYSWLNTPGNFLVTEVGKLTLVRTLQFGKTKAVKTQEVSATAGRKGSGPVQMWIGGNSQVDLYEVSNSLCRVILQHHKPNDSLLFMTILSTDLRALRRRGFNVDRVLRQQKAEREQVTREQQLVANNQPNTSIEDKISSQQSRQLQQLGSIANGADLRDSSSTKNLGNLFSNFRSKFQKPSSPLLPTAGTPTQPSPVYNETIKPRDPLSPYSQGPQWNSEQGVTPQANIERNVKAAIEGCRAENNAMVKSQASMTRVKEAIDEGYCDTMGAISLDLVGIMGRFKVYAATNGPPHAKAAIENMRPAITRFGELIILPLIGIYNIPSTSVQIFHDWSGPLIAFNRNGSLFLNLRYYIAWHDQDVQNRNFVQAYTSWYFSLAHEIAHNLVHPHNSEHEFYFSTICEQHMLGLSNLLRLENQT